MSEEKLYAVNNDEGLLLLYSEQGAPLWRVWGEMFADKSAAERAANAEHGHVVTLIEEPKKVVLTKKQAEIVEKAHDYESPANYISCSSDEEELLMEAYVNGYTVAKEKKYLVYKELGGKQKNKQVAQAYRSVVFPNTIKWLIKEREIMNTPACAQFTEAEIEQYGLQDCEKVWCDSDD